MANPSTDNHAIADVQGSEDTRNMPIQRVGIKAYRHPVHVTDETGEQASVAETAMYVSLPATQKGTHMSRFIELIENIDEIDIPALEDLLDKVTTRLNAENAYVDITFPFFIKKAAPVTQKASFMDYEVRYDAIKEDDEKEVWLEILVPVTSLCPCSKEISAYGAHNQRSHIVITLLQKSPANIEDYIRMVEKEGSCELFGTLKREDEKHVTERAYDNPKFVEDIVRDVALNLSTDNNVLAYRVTSENFESIHNHSAYAVIEEDKRD